MLMIRNDSNNSFNTLNSAVFEPNTRITACNFCPKSKFITVMTQNYTIYQFRNFETKISRGMRFVFARGVNDAEERVVIQHEYCSRYEILILLNNRNEVVIVERLNLSNHITLKIDEILPYKLKHLAFSRFTYILLKDKNNMVPSLLIFDDLGYLLDISLHKILSTRFANTKKEETFIRPFASESYELKTDLVSV